MKTSTVLCWCVLIALPMWAEAQTERFVFILNGEKVGTLTAERSGSRITVDSRVDDNGRGARTQESIMIGSDGLPRSWSIKGVAWYGAPVEESFDWQEDQAHWKTLNDQGASTVSGEHLYLPNDASYYALGVYLGALFKAPDHLLQAWPAGTVRAERIREAHVRIAGNDQEVTAWALWGLDVAPVFVVSDGAGRFRGLINETFAMLPEEWGGSFDSFKLLAASLNKDRLGDMARRVTHRWDVPVYLRNVRVFDPTTGTLSALTTVVSFRGVITGVGADLPAPADAVSIDGEGGTVLPGLFDVHVHIGAWDGPLHIAAGVTTVRDMGNDNLALLDLVEDFDAGNIPGPRVIRSGFVEGRSPFSAHNGFVVDNLSDALDAVRWYAARGYWQLKIYNSAHPDWVPALAAEAHRLGMRVAGHVPAFSSSERVVREGYDEVTHINQLLLGFLIDTDKEDTRTPFRFTALGERTGTLDLAGERFQAMVRLMRERGTALDTTLAVFYDMLLARRGELTPVRQPYADHMPGPVQRGLKSAILDMKPQDDSAYRASAQRLLDAVKLLHDAGVPILPGTDDSAGLVLHSELETWQRAGIAPAEILRIATLGCARYFHLDQSLGTVERGKRADLLLIPGDPTHDVGLIRQVRMVMKDGAVYFPSEIHTGMEIKPFSKPPPMSLPAALAKSQP